MGAAKTPNGRASMMAKKKKNTGVPYEKLVQGIFQAIHNQQEVATTTVEQNKILQGKISTHQIDVYWKFQRGGIDHEVVVQAKDWRSTVKQGDLFHFKCVLDDLPNQPRGVFVTRTGYQQGAKDFAAAQGIVLYELHEPPPKKNITITTMGWAKFTAEFRSFKVPAPDPGGGTVDQVAMGLKATVFEPRYSNFAMHIDKSSLSLRPLPVLEANLFDQNRSPVGNMEALVRQELDLMESEKLNQKHIEHTFDTPTFLGPESTGDLFLKINKVTFDLEVVVTERPPHFNLPGFVKLVLRAIPSQKELCFIAREHQSP